MKIYVYTNLLGSKEVFGNREKPKPAKPFFVRLSETKGATELIGKVKP